MESVQDYAIFALDPLGRVLSWNPGAQRFKGYRAEEIIGKHFSVFYTEEDKQAGKPQAEVETATREGRVEDEGWRLRKDGTRFWANVVITALRDEKGELVGFAKVTRDLTERRRAELRAISAAKRVTQAEEASPAKAAFLAAMSHELRTPLNAIGGYADLLLAGIGGEVSARQRQYLERIRGSQRHLLAIINDILNFSRVESGKISYEIRTVSLEAVVNTVVPMIEPQAAAKSLKVVRSSFLDANVAGDQAKIEQILLNLLSNAVKFTNPGGIIDISCEVRGQCIELHVSDTGIGIPESEIGAIFQPFVQVGRSLTSKQEGAGLRPPTADHPQKTGGRGPPGRAPPRKPPPPSPLGGERPRPGASPPPPAGGGAAGPWAPALRSAGASSPSARKGFSGVRPDLVVFTRDTSVSSRPIALVRANSDFDGRPS